MRLLALFALVASIAAVSATPAPVPEDNVATPGDNVATPGDNALVARSSDGSVEIAKRSGCGSIGPLGKGHFVWFITVSCKAGAHMTCQATDASGCVPGKTNKIGSMEVDDPNDTFQIAKKKHTNTVQFVCPSGGKVRCQANFNDNDDGPGYSLRGMLVSQISVASIVLKVRPTVF
ncbi:hypothetical protein C8Q78DRAFT_988560 [Trametes maxima]|nr:hypothetical protein C8Q78DRAFT_988560 [Trametes maxima]